MSPHQEPALHFDARLRRLLRGTRLRALGHGLIRFGGTAGMMSLAAAWALGGKPEPGAFNAWGLGLSLLIGLVLLAWNFLIKPWRALGTAAQLAERIETEAEFANLVVAAEEAGRMPDRWPDDEPVAAELKRRLLARAALVLELVNPANILPLRYTRTAMAGLLVAASLALGLHGLVPAEMARGWFRLSHPGTSDTALVTGGLYAAAGKEQVVVGQDVALIGLDFTTGEGLAVAEIKVGGGTWQPLPTHKEALTTTPLGLPDPYRKWQAVAENIREDFAWRFRRGTLLTEVRQVEVRHYPLVTNLSARIIPPAYTRLPVRDLDRLPSWVEVPVGSRLELSGQVSHHVTAAALVAGNEDTLVLEVDSLQVARRLDVDRDRRFVVHLTDAFGLHNQSPLRYEVAAAPDQRPGVDLARPDDDGILPLSGEVVLFTEAADDYGLTQLRLLTRTGAAAPLHSDHGEEWLGDIFWDANSPGGSPQLWQEVDTASGVLRVRAKRLDDTTSLLRARIQLELRADGLDLVAGDGLELVVEAVDNKRPLPAGTSRSGSVRLMLPSAAEVLVAQAESNEDRKGELEEMRNRSRQLNVDLDRLNRELMKNPVPDWARQKEMEAAVDRQQKLQQELARVAQELQQELEKLAQSQLTSEAQLEKADEMSELLGQNNSDQLGELLQKMQEGGGQASPEDVARAMDEVARNQQDMARRLDAALAMLQRMAQEQELEGLTALLEQMIQKQQELADLSRQLAAQQETEEQQAGADAASEGESEGEGKEGEMGEGEEPQDTDTEGENPEGENADGESPAGEESESDSQDSDQQSGESSDSENSGDSPSPPPSSEELARRQEALEKELEQLQEKLEAALENLREENEKNPSDSSQDMAEALEEALDQVKKQRQEDKMGKAGEQLDQQDPSKAAEMQEQTLRDLGSLYSVLLKSQQAMQQAMKMEQVSSLRGFAADMLALSAKQEEISQKIPAQLRDMRTLDLTRDQHRLQKSAAGVRDGMGELMAEAPNRVMKILRQLDSLIEAMGQGVQAMEDNRAPVARRQARESLSQTNRIVIGMLTEAQMQGGGGGGGGSPQQSMAEQLQEMAQEQAGLNGVTEELRRMLADRGISQKARSEMQRLGEQQAEMAGRMGDLAEEERLKPEGERLLGDLSEMGRDMERISQEIDDGLVSEETLIRQERILGRMLDARNSVRRRDFTNRRESESSRRLYAEQEGTLGGDAGEDDSPFRLKYQPLEQAPMEYRDLVRRYFSALDSLGRHSDEPAAPSEEGGTP